MHWYQRVSKSSNVPSLKHLSPRHPESQVPFFGQPAQRPAPRCADTFCRIPQHLFSNHWGCLGSRTTRYLWFPEGFLSCSYFCQVTRLTPRSSGRVPAVTSPSPSGGADSARHGTNRALPSHRGRPSGTPRVLGTPVSLAGTCIAKTASQPGEGSGKVFLKF